MGRFATYGLCSTAVAMGVIGHAYYTRVQFYPMIVYLVTSKFCILALCNLALVLTVVLGQMTKAVFLGQLRDAELEILYENSRYAITETCLALTIFREEINLKVVALFTSLLFTKIFHWLCQSRLEHMEQAEVVSRSTHVRILSLMGTLAIVDTAFVVLCSLHVMEHGPTVMILFGFEFLIMYLSLAATFIRYLLHLVDMRVNGTWTNKSTYVFYLELLTEVIKLFVYLIFFMIIFTYYGMPLHILRDLWMSIKGLQRRIQAYLRYRRITANMNERFASPTEEQLDEMDRTCIICREEMDSETAKTLPCTHIFHVNCLRMWLQRQQTCPTCRADIPTDDLTQPRDPTLDELRAELGNRRPIDDGQDIQDPDDPVRHLRADIRRREEAYRARYGRNPPRRTPQPGDPRPLVQDPNDPFIDAYRARPVQDPPESGDPLRLGRVRAQSSGERQGTTPGAQSAPIGTPQRFPPGGFPPQSSAPIPGFPPGFAPPPFAGMPPGFVMGPNGLPIFGFPPAPPRGTTTPSVESIEQQIAALQAQVNQLKGATTEEEKPPAEVEEKEIPPAASTDSSDRLRYRRPRQAADVTSEAERRREEQRQRYNAIYGNNGSE